MDRQTSIFIEIPAIQKIPSKIAKNYGPITQTKGSTDGSPGRL
jgi:hypothetical protein